MILSEAECRVIHLPREATRLINALQRGEDTSGCVATGRGRPRSLAADWQSQIPRARADFAGLRESVRRWLDFHGAYTLDDAEARVFENIAYLWEQVDQALEEPSLEQLVPAVYEAVRCMDAVQRERARPHFSLQPAVNDFLMAGTAVVIGRAPWRAVHDRIPVLEHYLVNLRSLYRGSAHRLRHEVREDLERGFQQLELGLETSRMAADPESLREGLVHLQQGAGLLQHFLDWDRDDTRRLAERYTRFHIPLVGPSFEHCLEAARCARRAYWRPAVSHVRHVLIPRLTGWWAQMRATVLLPPGTREDRLHAVDHGLQRLDAAVATLLDERLRPEEALGRVEAVLAVLSDAFDAIEREAIRRENLHGTAGETWCDLIAGLLAETVPDLAVGRVVSQSTVPPGWEPVVERVKAYLDTGDPTRLLEAASLCAGKAHASEQPGEESCWNCPFCGASNPLGRLACAHCDGRPSAEAAAVASWEA